ncbi:MAG: hypothetical protein JO056_00315 [Alphaproteobacteria bacterium]|nr:hypothetical protein [Alphaproteobacteria bacterium]
MKPVILAAICGTLVAAGSANIALARKAKPGAVVLQLYYNPWSATILRSNNVASVTSPSSATYCITPIKPIDPHIVYAVASAEYLSSQWYPYGGYAVWQDTTVATDCPAGDLEVRTIYNGGLYPSGFSLVVFQ